MDDRSCRQCGALDVVQRSVLCKECKKAYSRDYYKNNRKYLLDKQSDYYNDNKETINLKRKKEYANNPEYKNSRLQHAKRYREEHRELIRQRKRLNKIPMLSNYNAMKHRCFNVNSQDYPLYGGRGITICDRWLGKEGFKNFSEDVGASFQEGLSLDRYPNPNGNYEPGNVRWATQTEQMNNVRRNIDFRVNVPEETEVVYEGEIITLLRLSCLTGIDINALKNRWALFGDIEKMINPKIITYRYIYCNHRYSAAELSMMSGIAYDVLKSRIDQRGWSVEKAISTPLQVNR